VREQEGVEKVVYIRFFLQPIAFGVICSVGFSAQSIQLCSGFMRSTRVLIIDDHPGMLNALVKMLSREFTVVGALASGESGFAHAVALNPDIIILDISLPDINGLEVAKRLRDAGFRRKIIFLSDYQDNELVRASFDLGAAGYVFKSQIIPDLTTAIEVALKGAQFVPIGMKQEISA